MLEQRHDKQKAEMRKAKMKKWRLDEACYRPDVLTNAVHEQVMRRAATYGCVALFKAVAKHQRDLKASLEAVDEEMDVLQRRTLRIEEQATRKLDDDLNLASQQPIHNDMVE